MNSELALEFGRTLRLRGLDRLILPGWTWRDHLGAALVTLAAKVVGFTPEDFPRAASAIRQVEQVLGGGTMSRRQRQYGGAFSVQFFVGKTDATHNKGASGTISIWDGDTAATLADTTENFTTVWNRIADLASGMWVIGITLPSGHELIAGECA